MSAGSDRFDHQRCPLPLSIDPERRPGHRGYASDMNLGPTELIIILVIVMLLFGATRLPKLARSLGEASKEFKDGIKESTSEAELAAKAAEKEAEAAKLADDARIDRLVAERMAEKAAAERRLNGE